MSTNLPAYLPTYLPPGSSICSAPTIPAIPLSRHRERIHPSDIDDGRQSASPAIFIVHFNTLLKITRPPQLPLPVLPPSPPSPSEFRSSTFTARLKYTDFTRGSRASGSTHFSPSGRFNGRWRRSTPGVILLLLLSTARRPSPLRREIETSRARALEESKEAALNYFR